MTDLEKVIKGFECCHVMVHDLGPDKTSCGICPYKDVQTEEQINLGGIECIAVLHDDALAMLKEQEAVVRCEDCENWIPGYMTDHDDFIPPKCGKYQQMVGHSAADYCSFAARKESR